MDCLLMRHGIALEMDEWSGLDETRPLTEEGKQKVRLVAQGLSALEVMPSHVFTSPLTRARETATIVHTILCPNVTVSLCHALQPGSSPQLLTTFLRNVPDHAVVLCVGHEPLLGMTASYWLTGQVSHHYPMKKAGAGLIHLPSTAREGEGLLRWWCTPAQLRALGS